MSRNPFSTQVIQGRFQGGRPQFRVAGRSSTIQPASQGHAFQVPETLRLAPSVGGRPLPQQVQQKMEGFFGADFSDVRVHVGPQAQQIGALAFTLGSNLYFAPGQYNPHSTHGQRLIGHELTHVVQQRAGRVRNPFGKGVAVVQDPGLETEADRMGMRAAMAPMPAPAARGAIQRQATPPGARPLAPHVQAAVAQPKVAHPTAQASPLTTAGPPQVIQGKFSSGFSQIHRAHTQAGVVQCKTTDTAIQLAPALASFQTVGGRPLPALMQRKMETLFGESFSAVRIHEGPVAQRLGAQVFTMGNHIYFAQGHSNPKTADGLRLLGRGLTHVVQQRSGRVKNPFGSGVAVVRDRALEAEAAQMATRAAALQMPLQASMPATVQRARARVIQRVYEDDLRAISLLAKAHYRAKNKKMKIEEIQAMYLDNGNVVISSNYDYEMQELEALFRQGTYKKDVKKALADMFEEATKDKEESKNVKKKKKKKKKNQLAKGYFSFDQSGKGNRNLEEVGAEAEALVKKQLVTNFGKSMFKDIKSAQISSNAADCAKRLHGQAGLLILLKGAGNYRHAEQNTLLALAHLLKRGEVPKSVEIRGVKDPCGACMAVLEAFAYAYKLVYNGNLNHGKIRGQKRDQIPRLDLEKLVGASGGTKFESFLTFYHAARESDRTKYKLSTHGHVKAATEAIEKMPLSLKYNAIDLLLEAYKSGSANTTFYITYKSEDLISFVDYNETNNHKDINLGVLLSSLYVKH